MIRGHYPVTGVRATIFYHDARKLESSIARQRLGKHIPAKANTLNNRRAVFYVIRISRIDTQRCGKYISAAVNQHATIEEAVFSMEPPQGYITRISSSYNFN
jgi:hypothetical protein